MQFSKIIDALIARVNTAAALQLFAVNWSVKYLAFSKVHKPSEQSIVLFTQKNKKSWNLHPAKRTLLDQLGEQVLHSRSPGFHRLNWGQTVAEKFGRKINIGVESWVFPRKLTGRSWRAGSGENLWNDKVRVAIPWRESAQRFQQNCFFFNITDWQVLADFWHNFEIHS